MFNVKIFVNVQNDFITGALKCNESSKVLDNICSFIHNTSEEDALYIAAKHVNYSDYMETHLGKHLPVLHCMADTDGVKLEPRFNKAFSETQNHFILEKYYLNTLRLQTSIDAWSYEYGYQDEDMKLEICGFNTSRDVLATAVMLKGAYPECDITVYDNLCADRNSALHTQALSILKNMYINVTSA